MLINTSRYAKNINQFDNQQHLEGPTKLCIQSISKWLNQIMVNMDILTLHISTLLLRGFAYNIIPNCLRNQYFEYQGIWIFISYIIVSLKDNC